MVDLNIKTIVAKYNFTYHVATTNIKEIYSITRVKKKEIQNRATKQ